MLRILTEKVAVRYRKRAYLCAGLVLCFATVAGAQSAYRTEVFGSVGVSEYVFRLGSPVRAVNFGGGVGFRPFSVDRSPFLRMLGLEFEANGGRVSTGNGSVTQAYFTGNALLHAPLGRVEPYLVLGGGMSHRLDSNRALDVGVGAKVFVSPRVSIRPEFRGFGAEYNAIYARISVGAGYHW